LARLNDLDLWPADILNATRAHGKSRNPSSALVCGTCHNKEFAEKKPDLGGAIVLGVVFGLERISPQRLRKLKDLGRYGK